MTTLFLSQHFPPEVGGTCRWYWELLRRQPRSDYVLAVGEHPGQVAFDRSHDLRLQRLPLDLTSRGLVRPGHLAAQARALLALHRLIRRTGVSRLLTARPHPEGWLALILKVWLGLPYSTFVLGEEVKLLPRGASGTMASRQLRWMSAAALRSADRLIAVSQNTAAILRDEWRLPDQRIRVLQPGVDTAWFRPAPPDQEVRRELGWLDRRVVLTVARLEPQKGHDQLLRALPRIRQVVPDLLYAVVGAGSQRTPLERLAGELGVAEQVCFQGELPDELLRRCYQQCDLFVLPNRQVGLQLEGFGLVLLEAQACGKAVVAGASGGAPEALSTPETGLVLSCETPDALAATLPVLLRDPARLARMGRAGRAWVERQFDFDARAAAARAVLELRGDRAL